tara:strand:+ start:42 stop:230 length:189 start_codon:yes stop_codon:yes gene_type:complete
MNYLKMYCETFDLKIEGNKILDKDNNLIGKVEDEKYVRFTYQKNAMKMSDLLLPTFEKLSVH